MNLNVTNRYGIPVSTSAKYLQNSISGDVILPSISVTINLSIIFLTVLLEPFKSSGGVKNIVVLQCFSGFIFYLHRIIQYIFCYILYTYKLTTVIIVSTFLEQFNLFLYNFYSLVPVIITYWRFMLIVYNRKVSIFENIAVSILIVFFNLICLIYTLFFSKLIFRTSQYSSYYSYGSLEDDVFAWFDMMPQIIGCTISLILNVIIIKKIKNDRMKSVSSKKNSTNEIALTINIIFHTIMPLISTLYVNIYYYLKFQKDISSDFAEIVLELLEKCYAILCPIILIFFIKMYRTYFKKILCTKNIISVKLSISKAISI